MNFTRNRYQIGLVFTSNNGSSACISTPDVVATGKYNPKDHLQSHTAHRGEIYQAPACIYNIGEVYQSPACKTLSECACACDSHRNKQLQVVTSCETDNVRV